MNSTGPIAAAANTSAVPIRPHRPMRRLPVRRLMKSLSQPPAMSPKMPANSTPNVKIAESLSTR